MKKYSVSHYRVVILSCLLTSMFVGFQGCTGDRSGTSVSNGSVLKTDPVVLSNNSEKPYIYGLDIQSPWEDGGKLFLNFPEHLEYNPVGNTILRHYDKIPFPWIISPDKKQAAYRVESPALKNVIVESTVRSVTKADLPVNASGVKLSMRIQNNGTDTLPVIRPLICMQYSGLKGFSQSLQENFAHSFIIIDGKITALADFPTEDTETTFKGSVVRGSPQRDTRSEEFGGLIEKDMDLALSVVTSLDNQKKVIIFWTPGKSMIANARIPCLHADPYFGTLKPGDEAYAEGYILFTEGEIQPVIDWLKSLDKRVF